MAKNFNRVWAMRPRLIDCERQIENEGSTQAMTKNPAGQFGYVTGALPGRYMQLALKVLF